MCSACAPSLQLQYCEMPFHACHLPCELSAALISLPLASSVIDISLSSAVGRDAPNTPRLLQLFHGSFEDQGHALITHAVASALSLPQHDPCLRAVGQKCWQLRVVHARADFVGAPGGSHESLLGAELSQVGPASRPPP